jgi:hypothetical protein
MVVLGSVVAPRIVGCGLVPNLDPLENPLIAKRQPNALCMSIKDDPPGRSFHAPARRAVL